jgi:hypothetical protein
MRGTRVEIPPGNPDNPILCWSRPKIARATAPAVQVKSGSPSVLEERIAELTRKPELTAADRQRVKILEEKMRRRDLKRISKGETI